MRRRRRRLPRSPGHTDSSGQVRSGQGRSGQVRTAQVSSGQLRSGQDRSGQTAEAAVGSCHSSGQGRAGQRRGRRWGKTVSKHSSRSHARKHIIHTPVPPPPHYPVSVAKFKNLCGKAPLNGMNNHILKPEIKTSLKHFLSPHTDGYINGELKLHQLPSTDVS